MAWSIAFLSGVPSRREAIVVVGQYCVAFAVDLLPFVGEEDGVVLRSVVSAAAVGKLDKQRRAYLVGRFPRCEAISVFVRKTEEKAHNLSRYAIGRFSRLC